MVKRGPSHAGGKAHPPPVSDDESSFDYSDDEPAHPTGGKTGYPGAGGKTGYSGGGKTGYSGGGKSAYTSGKAGRGKSAYAGGKVAGGKSAYIGGKAWSTSGKSGSPSGYAAALYSDESEYDESSEDEPPPPPRGMGKSAKYMSMMKERMRNAEEELSDADASDDQYMDAREDSADDDSADEGPKAGPGKRKRKASEHATSRINDAMNRSADRIQKKAKAAAAERDDDEEEPSMDWDQFMKTANNTEGGTEVAPDEHVDLDDCAGVFYAIFDAKLGRATRSFFRAGVWGSIASVPSCAADRLSSLIPGPDYSGPAYRRVSLWDISENMLPRAERELLRLSGNTSRSHNKGEMNSVMSTLFHDHFPGVSLAAEHVLATCVDVLSNPPDLSSLPGYLSDIEISPGALKSLFAEILSEFTKHIDVEVFDTAAKHPMRPIENSNCFTSYVQKMIKLAPMVVISEGTSLGDTYREELAKLLARAYLNSAEFKHTTSIHERTEQLITGKSSLQVFTSYKPTEEQCESVSKLNAHDLEYAIKSMSNIKMADSVAARCGMNADRSVTESRSLFLVALELIENSKDGAVAHAMKKWVAAGVEGRFRQIRKKELRAEHARRVEASAKTDEKLPVRPKASDKERMAAITEEEAKDTYKMENTVVRTLREQWLDKQVAAYVEQSKEEAKRNGEADTYLPPDEEDLEAYRKDRIKDCPHLKLSDAVVIYPKTTTRLLPMKNNTSHLKHLKNTFHLVLEHMLTPLMNRASQSFAIRVSGKGREELRSSNLVRVLEHIFLAANLFDAFYRKDSAKETEEGGEEDDEVQVSEHTEFFAMYFVSTFYAWASRLGYYDANGTFHSPPLPKNKAITKKSSPFAERKQPVRALFQAK